MGVLTEKSFTMDDGDPEFQKRVISVFRAMKFELDQNKEAWTIPICLQGKVLARLRPVQARFTRQELKLLMEWRNQNREAFITWVTSTEESTRTWLSEQILSREDRILFLAEPLSGDPWGQIGLTNFDFSMKACELDNWIRGQSCSIRGGMMLAIRALMDWTFFFLQANSVYARVFSDNRRVTDLHMQNGLRLMKSVPLRKAEEKDKDMTRWIEVEGATPEVSEKTLLYLKIDRSDYKRSNGC